MTIDLTKNKIPFGLLSSEEQEHLNSWPHGLLLWEPETGVWSRTDLLEKLPTFVSRRHHVYRTIPAPKRETIWLAPTEFNDMSAEVYLSDIKEEVESNGGFAFRIEYDAETGDNPTIVKETFDG